MTRAALVAAVLASGGILAAAAPFPTAAWAAFEIRDASPASLGAASLDRRPAPMSPQPAAPGVRAGAAVTRFGSAAGVEIAGMDLVADGARRSLEVSYTRTGTDFAGEGIARLAIGERAVSGVGLEASVERLDLRVEGERSRGGWAAGGRAVAIVPAGRVDVALDVGCDRFLRSADLDALGVAPSLPFAISVGGPAGSVTWIDRWESGGAKSPRLVLDLALGGALRLRFARGSDPDRTGFAAALRLQRLEIAAGHLDFDSGIALAGVSIRYRVSGGPEGGKPPAGPRALLL
jgi:hypothetical protein